jgi:hypothetical protein
MERVSQQAAIPEPDTSADVKATASNTADEITISVESYLPENVPTHYSDGLTVLHTTNEFIISFLQTEFPLANSKEDLERVKSMKRKCITRIIVSPAQFVAIAKVFQESSQKYLEAYKKPEGE